MLRNGFYSLFFLLFLLLYPSLFRGIERDFYSNLSVMRLA